MIVRLNIGLASHGISESIICRMLINAIDGSYCGENKVLSWERRMSDGGNWDPEPVFVPEIEVGNVDRLKSGLAALCDVLGEDSIAVAILSPSVGSGVLIWNSNYSGEKYDFNLDYFTG